MGLSYQQKLSVLPFEKFSPAKGFSLKSKKLPSSSVDMPQCVCKVSAQENEVWFGGFERRQDSLRDGVTDNWNNAAPSHLDKY